MRRRKFISALSLSLAASAYGNNIPFTFLKKQNFVPACSTLALDDSITYTDSVNTSFYNWLGNQFTTAGGFTCCKATLNLIRTNTLSGTLQVLLYTVSGINPGVLVGTGSDLVDVSSVIAGSANPVIFTGLSAVLSPATSYFIILKGSASFVTIDWIADAGLRAVKGSVDGTSWDGLGTKNLDFKLYSA